MIGHASVDRVIAHGGTGLVVRTARAVYVDSGLVTGTEAFAILTFSNVNGASVGLMRSVNFDVSVGVFGARSDRTG